LPSSRRDPIRLWSLALLASLTVPAARAAEGPITPDGAGPTAPAAPAATAEAKPSPVTGDKEKARQLAQTPETPPAVPPPAEEKQGAAAAEEKKPAPPSLDISGFVDGYYEYNFNRPPAFKRDASGAKVRNDIENKLRNFDFKHNEFALNLLEVVVQRAPAPVGFRIDLDFGKATDWVHAAEPGGAETYKHFQQAYLTVPLRFLGKGDTLDFGKFVTHHGAEVIETKDNWNYTRSLLFAWAIPYYHAGLRYRHPFTDTTALTLFLYNGWNNVEDNNNALSYGLMFNTNLTKKLALVQNWTGGPELNDDNSHWRHLFDTVLTYNASAKTAYVLNFDYAREARPVKAVSWIGFAGYVRQALTDRNAVVVRGEWFDDRDGASTGTAQSVKEVTLTFERKHSANVLTRAEFRYDWSDKSVFDKRGGTSKQQPTLLVGAVYAF
jgi:hypothetical protein